MNQPSPREFVIASKRDAGRVTVHGSRRGLWDTDSFQMMTDCKLRAQWALASWLWLQYRTLNPERVVLCKRCWGKGK